MVTAGLLSPFCSKNLISIDWWRLGIFHFFRMDLKLFCSPASTFSSLFSAHTKQGFSKNISVFHLEARKFILRLCQSKSITFPELINYWFQLLQDTRVLWKSLICQKRRKCSSYDGTKQIYLAICASFAVQSCAENSCISRIHSSAS